jgi:methylated-DNA-[protein]-cysteine S-methyltransferase
MENALAIRAVAADNGENNLLLVVPCHRVIASSGELVGFSDGLWQK